MPTTNPLPLAASPAPLAAALDPAQGVVLSIDEVRAFVRELDKAKSPRALELANLLRDRSAANASQEERKRLDAYRQAASEIVDADEVEFDEGAAFSEGDEDGAWVAAWVWVPNEDAGLPSGDEDDPAESEGAKQG